MTIIAEGIGMPSEVFVYQLNTNEDSNPVEGDTFRCVAAVNDLFEFPAIRNPVQEGDFQIPYYRRKKVELIYRSPQEADEDWVKFLEEIDDLVANYCAAERLQQVGTHEATCEAPNDIEVIEKPIPEETQQVLLELAIDPNGEAEVDENDNQSIVEPYTPEEKGWLPVSEVPEEFIQDVPVGAKYFYNIDQDEDLKEIFPLPEPYNQHILTYQGDILVYGEAYTITKDTIYWMTFDPGSLSEYDITGNAPWPLDYFDEQNPGENPVELQLRAFIKV
jgi:hypothetical protein